MINTNMNYSDLDQRRLLEVANEVDFSPKELIDLLKQVPAFYDLMMASAGISQRYTIEEHSKMVLGQLEKYFQNDKLPSRSDRGFYRILLALHDIGKPIAIQNGNKKLQHVETAPIVRKFLEFIKYDQSSVNLGTAILSGDPIGEFFQSELSEEKTVELIKNMAEIAQLEVLEFFRILKIVYMVDAGSYTLDAGGPKALDRLFVFKPKEGEMDFAEPFKASIVQLEASLSK